MKQDDIKVGGHYAWSYDDYGHNEWRSAEVEVLETRVRNNLGSGRYGMSNWAVGCLVRHIGDARGMGHKDGMKVFATSRQIRMPWDEYVALKAAHTKSELEEASRRRASLLRDYQEAFEVHTALMRLGVTPREVRVYREEHRSAADQAGFTAVGSGSILSAMKTPHTGLTLTESLILARKVNEGTMVHPA